MAMPIKETPILFGEDARKFEERMKHPRKETPEEKEKRLKHYQIALRMLKKQRIEQYNFEYLSATYDIRKLGKDDHIKSFDCEDADLNDFILNECSLYRNALLAVSYVVEKKTGEHEVISAAVPFYLKNGFVPLTDNDKDDLTRLLYFDLGDIADS